MALRSAQQRIQELLEALRIGLDLDLAFVGEFTQGKRVFRFVSGGLAAMDIRPGMSDPLEETYCHWIAEGRMPGVIQDAQQEPTARKLAATAQAQIRSHVGIPLLLSDGRLFGSLCAAGTSLRPDLDERVLYYVRNVAQVIARELEEVLISEQEFDRRVDQISRLMDTHSFDTHLQPIVDLDSAQIVSVEALTRFKTNPYRPPDDWIAEAWAVGLGTEMELTVARKAVSYIPKLDASLSLAINVSPATLLTPEFIDDFAPFGERLIVEVTEHDAVEDYQKLLHAVEPLTDLGIKLAVDDVGSGYASLAHILELSPDIVKLDISLTRQIERDMARHAMVAALVTFANRVDVRLVAEGIETPEARDVLRTLGVKFGQGYFFARSSPASDLANKIAQHGLRIAS